MAYELRRLLVAIYGVGVVIGSMIFLIWVWINSMLNGHLITASTNLHGECFFEILILASGLVVFVVSEGLLWKEVLK